MSSTSSSSSSIPMNPISQCIDPLDAFFEFGNVSPAASPSTLSARPAHANPNNTLLPPADSTDNLFSAPSHPYGSYRQHTGIPSGSIQELNRMNASQSSRRQSAEIFGDDAFDFNAVPTSAVFGGPELDMDFNSPSADAAFLFPERSLSSSSAGYINPNAIGGHEELSGPSPQSLVPSQAVPSGRLWPGAHQQAAAIAKAQAQAEQQKQQQLIMQRRQHQQQMAMNQQRQHARPRGSQQPSDPIVEEKISQLLNSMRQGSVAASSDDGHNGDGHGHGSMLRMRKDEEDMDEDERLLASEEGKKLSSKERRQLRNKVSARAFRSRRKEYITQLEGEVAIKANEANDLRNQNRILRDENKRLEDLTRMLLSSPQFSDFLDAMSRNPAPASAPRPEQLSRQEARQAPGSKDPNPFAAQQQTHQNGAHIGMALIPDSTMNLSMLGLNENSWGVGTNNSNVWNTNQPQVFAVTEVPEGPAVDQIDTAVLSEKPCSISSTYLPSDSEKSVPTIKHLPVIREEKEESSEAKSITDVACDDSDPAFALYSDAPVSVTEPEVVSELIFGDKAASEVFARLELVDASEEEAQNIMAMDRFQRRCESIDASLARIQDLISHL